MRAPTFVRSATDTSTAARVEYQLAFMFHSSLLVRVAGEKHINIQLFCGTRESRQVSSRMNTGAVVDTNGNSRAFESCRVLEIETVAVTFYRDKLGALLKPMNNLFLDEITAVNRQIRVLYYLHKLAGNSFGPSRYVGVGEYGDHLVSVKVYMRGLKSLFTRGREPARGSQMKSAKQRLYRNTLFVLLAFTRALERADFHVPTKWYSVLDSLRVSSGVLHERIGFVDPDVERQFRKVEKQIDRRLGKEQFYSQEEVDQLQDRIEDIRI